MSQREEEDEGALSSDSTLSEKHDSQTKPESYKQKEADSPEPSCVSMQSDWMKDFPSAFRSHEPVFADSPEDSSLSMRSNWSKDFSLDFKKADSLPREVCKDKFSTKGYEYLYISLLSAAFFILNCHHYISASFSCSKVTDCFQTP